MNMLQIFSQKYRTLQRGQSLVELLLTIGLAAVIIPALYTGIIASRNGKAQEAERVQAVQVLKEAEEGIKNVQNTDWGTFAVNGTYHPEIANNKWVLVAGSQTVNGYTTQAILTDIYRNNTGAIVASGSAGATFDPSTKQVVTTISWTQPYSSSLTSTLYLTRTGNITNTQNSAAAFNAGTLINTQVTVANAIKLANNNKGKWCSPSLVDEPINLPDGPPVAVAATASATTTSIPNDVIVATAPYATSSSKMVYITVTADTATPSSTLKGTFTLDASKYSAGTYPGSIGTITNSFKTNDIKYYTSSSGKFYGLLATDDPNHEIVVVQIKSGGTDAYQDSVNKIYKYWTFFNTIPYNGSASNDQAPYGYGATSLTILGTKGYLTSGGYLYAFDLSNIDSKTPTSGLDMVGCRIQLDGYDCKPGSPGTDAKYSAGHNPLQSGATWTDTVAPAHNDCSDGGNIELHADNDIYPVQVGANTYIYVAVGGGTNPEFEIADVSTIPTAATSPTISSRFCGIINTTNNPNSGWRLTNASVDFNGISGTEEAANSVFGKSDGTRAYVSSNGGIDANGDGKPDSFQFYVLDTTNKNAPKFLSGSTSPPTTGYYYGGIVSPTPTGPVYHNEELFPRRSLTVLNGQRAVLVGKDGITNGNDAQEYQVVDMTNEASPTYCGGVNFNQGFNDLTAITEANGDNYVYMVANTPDKQLKIIQGGPDNAIFVPSGTFESSTIDPGYSAAFNRLYASVTQPTSTSIQLQVATEPAISGSCNGVTFNYVGPNGDPSQYFQPVNNASISATIPFGQYINNTYQNPGRCFRYKAYLSTTDQTQTPSLTGTTTNYSP